MNQFIVSDCIQKIAYLFMLKKASILTEEEFAVLQEGIKEFKFLTEKEPSESAFDLTNFSFPIDQYLREKLGSLTKKIENPSIYNRLLTDTHLFLEKELLLILKDLLSLIFYTIKNVSF